MARQGPCAEGSQRLPAVLSASTLPAFAPSSSADSPRPTDACSSSCTEGAFPEQQLPEGESLPLSSHRVTLTSRSGQGSDPYAHARVSHCHIFPLARAEPSPQIPSLRPRHRLPPRGRPPLRSPPLAHPHARLHILHRLPQQIPRTPHCSQILGLHQSRRTRTPTRRAPDRRLPPSAPLRVSCALRLIYTRHRRVNYSRPLVRPLLPHRQTCPSARRPLALDAERRSPRRAQIQGPRRRSHRRDYAPVLAPAARV